MNERGKARNIWGLTARRGEEEVVQSRALSDVVALF